jgi:hypothetical protein
MFGALLSYLERRKIAATRINFMTDDERKILSKICEIISEVLDSQVSTTREVLALRDALLKTTFPGIEAGIKQAEADSLLSQIVSSPLRDMRREIEGLLELLRRPSVSE